MREKHLFYSPYNSAMLMLRLGLFKEAFAEFEKFLVKDHSVKNRLIYFLIALSRLMKRDLVSPLARAKEKAEASLR